MSETDDTRDDAPDEASANSEPPPASASSLSPELALVWLSLSMSTQRLLTESRVLWFYVGMIVYPDVRSMSLYHDDFLVSTGLLEPGTTLLAIAAWGMLLGCAIAWRRRFQTVAANLTENPRRALGWRWRRG